MQVGSNRGRMAPVGAGPQPQATQPQEEVEKASWWKSGLVGVALSSSTENVSQHPLYDEKWGALFDDISSMVFAQVKENAGTMTEGLGPQVETAVRDLIGYTLFHYAQDGLDEWATAEQAGAHLAANLAGMAKKHLTGGGDPKIAMQAMAKEMLEGPFPGQGDDPHLPRAARWLLGKGKKNVAVKYGAKALTGTLSWTWGLWSKKSYTVDLTGIDWDFLVKTMGDTLHTVYEQVNEVEGAVARVDMQELEKHPGAKELAQSLTQGVMGAVRGMRNLPIKLEMFSETTTPFVNGIFRNLLRAGEEETLRDTWGWVESTLQNGVQAVFASLLKDGGINGLLDGWLNQVMSEGGEWQALITNVRQMDDGALMRELSELGDMRKPESPNRARAVELAAVQEKTPEWKKEVQKLLLTEKFQGVAAKLLKDQLQSEEIKALFPSAFPADKALPIIHNIVAGYLLELTEDVQQITERGAAAKTQLEAISGGGDGVVAQITEAIDQAVNALEAKAKKSGAPVVQTGFGVVDQAIMHLLGDKNAEVRKETKRLVRQVLYTVLAEAMSKHDGTPQEALQQVLKEALARGKDDMEIVRDSLAEFRALAENPSAQNRMILEVAQELGYSAKTLQGLGEALGLEPDLGIVIQGLLNKNPAETLTEQKAATDYYTAITDREQQLSAIQELATAQGLDSSNLRLLAMQLDISYTPDQVFEALIGKAAARDIMETVVSKETFNSLLPEFLANTGLWNTLSDIMGPYLHDIAESQGRLLAKGAQARTKMSEPLVRFIDETILDPTVGFIHGMGAKEGALVGVAPEFVDQAAKGLVEQEKAIDASIREVLHAAIGNLLSDNQASHHAELLALLNELLAIGANKELSDEQATEAIIKRLLPREFWDDVVPANLKGMVSRKMIADNIVFLLKEIRGVAKAQTKLADDAAALVKEHDPGLYKMLEEIVFPKTFATLSSYAEKEEAFAINLRQEIAQLREQASTPEQTADKMRSLVDQAVGQFIQNKCARNGQLKPDALIHQLTKITPDPKPAIAAEALKVLAARLSHERPEPSTLLEDPTYRALIRESLGMGDPILEQATDAQNTEFLVDTLDMLKPDPLARVLPKELDDLLKRALSVGEAGTAVRELTRNLVYAVVKEHCFAGAQLDPKKVLDLLNDVIKVTQEPVNLQAIAEAEIPKPIVLDALKMTKEQWANRSAADVVNRLRDLGTEFTDRYHAVLWTKQLVTDNLIETAIPGFLIDAFAKEGTPRCQGFREFLAQYVVSIYTKEVRETVDMLETHAEDPAQRIAHLIGPLVGGMAEKTGFGFGIITDEATAAALGPKKKQGAAAEIGSAYLERFSQDVVTRLEKSTSLQQAGIVPKLGATLLHGLFGDVPDLPEKFQGKEILEDIKVTREGKQERVPREIDAFYTEFGRQLTALIYTDEKHLPVPASAQGALLGTIEYQIAVNVEQQVQGGILATIVSQLGSPTLDTEGKSRKPSQSEFHEAVMDFVSNKVFEFIQSKLPDPLGLILGAILGRMARIAVWMAMSISSVYETLNDEKQVQRALYQVLQSIQNKGDQPSLEDAVNETAEGIFRVWPSKKFDFISGAVAGWVKSSYGEKKITDLLAAPLPAKSKAT